ncbi:hypothetical protein ABEF95_015025 [Exophiala dermatitidis]
MAEVQAPFDSCDLETADLILRLQLEDVQDLRDRSKDQNSGDELNDTQLALSLLEQNLESTRFVISDMLMTRSIADAVQKDGGVITQVIREEETACEDHTLAHRLNGTDVTSEVNLHSNIDTKLLSKLAGLYVSEAVGRELFDGFHEAYRSESESSTTEAGSSRLGTREKGKGDNFELRCVACHENKKYFDVIEAPCGHGYCKPCLQELFDLSTKDESLFPPRCCRQPLELQDVHIFLTKEIKDRFERAKVEFSTADRTYCSDPSCSAFIPAAAYQGDVATCIDCGTRTCITCKAGAHTGDCPNDSALRETLALATASGWQRCYSCGRLIELDVGCNHMT